MIDDGERRTLVTLLRLCLLQALFGFTFHFKSDRPTRIVKMLASQLAYIAMYPQLPITPSSRGPFPVSSNSDKCPVLLQPQHLRS
jgi:hypothetical protein